MAHSCYGWIVVSGFMGLFGLLLASVGEGDLQREGPIPDLEAEIEHIDRGGGLVNVDRVGRSEGEPVVLLVGRESSSCSVRECWLESI